MKIGRWCRVGSRGLPGEADCLVLHPLECLGMDPIVQASTAHCGGSSELEPVCPELCCGTDRNSDTDEN